MTDDSDPFDDAPISRRQFVRLSAATGGALALPGTGSAEAPDASAYEPTYRFVLSHTPDEYAVPTLVEFSDPSGVAAFEALDVGEAVHTTTEPKPAAYAQLTGAEAATAADLPTAETFSHSPGANPFWRLGYYPFGVFPEATRSVDFIDFDENIQGLRELESRHPDRTNVFSIGKGHGKYNYATDRTDPREVMVVEVTNDVDGDDFEDKQKVMFSGSVHGDERAGTEACSRFIENLLRGEEPKTEALLDDLVLIFAYPNPDGWTARRPQYDSYGVPGATLHERGNFGGDTNRQFPIPGWIDPSHKPAEPLGTGLDGDTDPPDYIVEEVPDALDFVEHFRDYENLTHGADFHGMLFSEYFTQGLESHVQSTNDEHHDLAEMNRRIDDALTEELDVVRLSGAVQDATVSTGVVPEEPYDYSPSWEGIGYSGTGYMKDWMSQPEEWGCLDMTMMTMEMSYSNIVGGNVYDQARVDAQVRAYRSSIREIADHATTDVETEIETGGETLGYVTTDALTRTSDGLSFLEKEGRTVVDDEEYGIDVAGSDRETATFDVEAGRHSMSVHPHAEPQGEHPAGGLADAALVAPDGEVVRDFEVVGEDRVGGECCGMVTWNVTDPQAGEWTLVAANRFEAPTRVVARVTTMGAEGGGPNPDPVDAVGYQQRAYESTPFRYFEDLAEELDTDPVAYTVDEVADGAVDTDHLVVIHDDGRNDDAYLDALDAYVESGGNLVLTDTAANLLPDLDGDLAAGVSADDIENRGRTYREPERSDDENAYYVAHIGERNDDHPLLADSLDSQQLLWHIAGLGYATNKAPMTLVDRDAFAATDDGVASVAGTTSGLVSAGSRTRAADDATGIHFVGSLLPPAHQREIHPFGMMSYGMTFFGHIVLMNTLGFRQVRTVDGEVVATFGWDSFEVDGEDPLDLNFDRETDASVYTAGQTTHQTITATTDDADDASADGRVADTVPGSWDVAEEYGDVADVESLENGRQRVVFEPAADGEVDYFAEAPDGLGSTGRYEFGPVEVDVDGEWRSVGGTGGTVSVVGVET